MQMKVYEYVTKRISCKDKINLDVDLLVDIIREIRDETELDWNDIALIVLGGIDTAMSELLATAIIRVSNLEKEKESTKRKVKSHNKIGRVSKKKIRGAVKKILGRKKISGDDENRKEQA